MTDRDPKILIMLAGVDADLVFYQMQPAFLADQRFSVASISTSWADFEKNLMQLKPHLVVVQAEIAPAAEALLAVLARMQVWNGLALILLQGAHRELRGVFEKAQVCRGVFILPLNWGDLVQAGFAAVATERARTLAQNPLQQAAGLRTSTAITGTRVVAFVSGSGGSGRSTLAESVAYQLAVRLNVRTLLASFDLPPSAVMHLNLRYAPHAGEYFTRPGDGFQAAIQSRESLEVLVAPESSLDYARAGDPASAPQSASPSIHSLVMACWTRNYAAVLLDLPSGEGSWTLQPLLAANTALIVTRTTLEDLAATRHMLVLLLERMRGEHRIPQESIFLVLNQVNDNSSITPRGFYEELAQSYGWAPPVLAVLPFDAGIPRAQDAQKPPVLTVDSLAEGTGSIIQGLFPGLDRQEPSRAKGKGAGFLRGKLGRGDS
jgi:Flp pilus assembly CpaE family ATPase